MIANRIILEVTVDDKPKSVEFFTTSIFEYELGWKSSYIYNLEEKGRFPKTVFKVSNSKRRLFTQEMVNEVVDLIENNYPVFYNGRCILKKAYNVKEYELFKPKVQELEQKWKDEFMDYLRRAPNKPKIRHRKQYVATE